MPFDTRPRCARTLLRASGILCALLFAVSTAHADPTVLKFAFTAPPTTWVNTMGAEPWAKEVEAEAAGALEIKFFYAGALGNAGNIYDRTINGVAQIAFNSFGELSSQFPKTGVVALPFETKNCTESALALWRIYKSGVVADEYTKVHPLSLFAFPDFVLTTKKSITKMSDMDGVKISIGSRVVGQSVQLLGGVPIALKPSDVYQAVQRGVVDGMILSWAGISVYKVDELTKYDLDMPLGVGPGFIFMNKEAYASLPEAGRRAIDKYSGDALTERLAKACFIAGEENRPNLISRGHTISVLTPQESERWKARVAPITEEWVKTTPDGAKVLAAFRAEVARIKAGGSL